MQAGFEQVFLSSDLEAQHWNQTAEIDEMKTMKL
jgi:hypothetical protein